MSGMDLGFNRHSTGSVNVSKGFDLKDAGWTNPIGKKISRNQSFEVIGVVEDFHFSSLYEPVAPLIISVNPKNGFLVLTAGGTDCGHRVIRIIRLYHG